MEAVRYLTDEERIRLLARAESRTYAANETILAEGDDNEDIYILIGGAARVEKLDGDKSRNVGRIAPGEAFGEMSLLTRQPATATVTSPGNAILLRLPRDKFQELVVTHPQILALVSELTDQRAAATRAALERHGISSFV